MNKEELLERTAQRILECSRCELRQNASQPVPGIGNPDAEYMIIGEAPGSEEDKVGIPFVGKSGQKLDQLTALAGIDKNSCYYTNTVRCRPPKNRNPRKKEMAACREYLENEMLIIQPKYVITLGAIPLGLFAQDGLKSMHGTMFPYEIGEE